MSVDLNSPEMVKKMDEMTTEAFDEINRIVAKRINSPGISLTEYQEVLLRVLTETLVTYGKMLASHGFPVVVFVEEEDTKLDFKTVTTMRKVGQC